MSLAPDELAAAAQCFALGLTRAPLPPRSAGSLAADQPLKLLALAGQAARFTRLAVPEAFDPISSDTDPRPIITDRARMAIARVEPTGSDIASMALADAMARRRVRLHPFDFPLLAPFINANAATLGGTALGFAAAGDKVEIERDAFADSLDEDNWTRGGPARKAEFLRSIRATDAERGRNLLETVFRSFKAESRLALVRVLRNGLSAADLPFLESLAGDRAPTVKEEARLGEALSRIKLTRSGILRRKTEMSLELPAHLQSAWQVDQWLRSAFADLPLAVLAGHLEISIEAFTELAIGNPAFHDVLTRQATAERRFGLLARLAAGGGHDLWQRFLPDDLVRAELSDVERGQWIEAMIRPQSWTEVPNPQVLDNLYRISRGPLGDELARAIRSAGYWRIFCRTDMHEALAVATFTAIAAMTSSAMRRFLSADLAALPIDRTHRALTLLEALDSIDPP
jgi:hypothetical protein